MTTTQGQASAHVAEPDHARTGKTGRPLTDAQRLQIYELADAGLSVRQVAARLGVAPSTVTRTARRMGLVFDRSATEAATAARIADGQARRSELAVRLLELTNTELDRLSRPCRVHAFVGGGTPTYLEHVLPQPDATTRLAIARTAATLLDRHIRLAALPGGTEEDDAKSMLGGLAEGLRRLHAETIPADTGPLEVPSDDR